MTVDADTLRGALRYVSAWGCVPSGNEWLAKNQERIEDELRAAIAKTDDPSDVAKCIVAIVRAMPKDQRDAAMGAVFDGLACCRRCGAVDAGDFCCFESHPGE